LLPDLFLRANRLFIWTAALLIYSDQGSGKKFSMLSLYELLPGLIGFRKPAFLSPPRSNGVRDSLADTSRAHSARYQTRDVLESSAAQWNVIAVNPNASRRSYY
jgi:hypothetical protein